MPPPGCDSDISDHDHLIRVADGGETTRANGQGLYEAHNLVKELPGWSTHVLDPRPGRRTVEVRTPTGHTYRSHAPPVVTPATDPVSSGEARLLRLVPDGPRARSPLPRDRRVDLMRGCVVERDRAG